MRRLLLALDLRLGELPVGDTLGLLENMDVFDNGFVLLGLESTLR